MPAQSVLALNMCCAGFPAGLVAQERQLPEALQVVSRDGASTSANLILTGGTGSVSVCALDTGPFAVVTRIYSYFVLYQRAPV